MINIKSFLSISFCSIVIAFVLILLGVKYHWGGFFKESHLVVDLPLPKSKWVEVKSEETLDAEQFVFVPEILEESNVNSLLLSMNREQVEEQCINLLSRDIKDPSMLELATANCVLSNYQEDFESAENASSSRLKKLTINQQCSQQYPLSSRYSETEIQLLVGMCVSDRLVTN